MSRVRELLLVSASFPHERVTEFMGPEIPYLSEVFDTVTIAPTRPVGPILAPLPTNVVVDYSLAQVVPNASRRLQTVLSGVLSGRGLPPTLAAGEPHRDFLSASWARSLLLARADLAAIRQWAANRPAPDVVYTYWLRATAGLRESWPGTPMVSRAHGGDVYSQANGWRTIAFQHSALAACDWVACVSRQGRDYLSEKFPDQTDKLTVEHLGIPDVGGLAPRGSGGGLRVISASSVDANKRVLLIAECIATLASHTPVQWTHFGDGPQMQAVRELLSERASENLRVNLAGRVEPAVVHRALLEEGFDVFVNLSLSEGVPVSVMEAQCVGLPVVATDVGGTSEAAPATFNYLIPVDASVEAICDALTASATESRANPALRRSWWQERFDSSVVYPRFAAELLRRCHA